MKLKEPGIYLVLILPIFLLTAIVEAVGCLLLQQTGWVLERLNLRGRIKNLGQEMSNNVLRSCLTGKLIGGKSSGGDKTPKTNIVI